MDQQRNPAEEVADATVEPACSNGVRYATCLEGATAGTYRIKKLIGQGATSSVYLAEHPGIGAQVAIKVLHEDIAEIPGMGARFVREARASNMVDSPYVLRIQDFGKLDDGRDYAVMDVLRGLPLDALIEGEGALPLPRGLRLLTQIASGLAAAHDAAVLHRDVKPSNLFVTSRPEGEHVFILDFGIAKLLAAPPSSHKQTAAGALVGTPGYCAPEQVQPGPVGPPADVYALGCVAYEVLTGRPLFGGRTIVELLAEKLRAERAVLRGLPLELPPELVQLLDSMLLRDPTDRPSMREVETALRDLLEESVDSPPLQQTTYSPRRSVTRSIRPPIPSGLSETLPSAEFERLPPDCAPLSPAPSFSTSALTPPQSLHVMATPTPPAPPPTYSFPPVAADRNATQPPGPDTRRGASSRTRTLALVVALSLTAIGSFSLVWWGSAPTAVASGAPEPSVAMEPPYAVDAPQAPGSALAAEPVAAPTTPGSELAAEPVAAPPPADAVPAPKSSPRARASRRLSGTSGPIPPAVRPPPGLVDPFQDEPLRGTAASRR